MTNNALANALAAIPLQLPQNIEDYGMDPDSNQCPNDPGNPES